MDKLKNYFYLITTNKINFVLLGFVFVFSSLILFYPIEYLILAFLILIIIALFFYKPELALYSFVISIPLIRPNFHYLHFQDIFVFLCFLSLIINIALRRYPFINVTTSIDKWIICVTMLFLIKGLTSIELARGFLHAVRFLEAITLYYIVVYFIRAKKLKISTLLKLLIITTIFQALLGPLQSIFNNFGVQEYANNRGYFGYFGLGPTMVYSGRGTFWHFAAYGYYIGTIFLFLLPFYRNIIKNKFVFNLIFICLFVGILFSYSRGALAALIIGVVYYLVVVEHKKTRLLLKLLLIGMIITPFALYFLSNQEYLLSLNPRNQLWGFHITYLLQNPGELIWGAGFESRESTFYIYAPKYLRHPGDFNPHNLLLTYLEEIGIVGCLIYLSFWIKVFIDSFKNLKNNSKLMRTFNIGIQLVLVNVFLSGINDHVYHDPYLTMFLIFLLGIGYAKNNRSGEKHPI